MRGHLSGSGGVSEQPSQVSDVSGVTSYLSTVIKYSSVTSANDLSRSGNEVGSKPTGLAEVALQEALHKPK